MKHYQLTSLSFFSEILSSIFAAVVFLKAWDASGAAITYIDLNPTGAASSGAFGVSGEKQVGYAMIAGGLHAALWHGTVNSFVDLHPPGASYSIARAVAEQLQVGVFGNGSGHAAIWSGTPDSIIDLNPDFAASDALGVSSSQQVGNLSFGTPPQAVLWSGTASTYVILHPAGASASYANGVCGGQQVGYITIGDEAHAVIWAGTSNSCVDLHPMGAIRSEGNATIGLQQAGTVWTLEGGPHAALWSGTADSFVDLNPVGAIASYAFGIYGTEQVGQVQIGTNIHAALWAGNPESFLDLHSVLGTNYIDSHATAIHSTGSITRVVGDASTPSGNIHAIMWTISRPPTLALTSIQSLGNTNLLSLEWDNGGSAFILENASSMSATWSNTSASLATNGSKVTAAVTNVAPHQFFRLRSL